VVRRRGLAAALDQRAVGVEEQLGVVERAAIALVDADRHDDRARPARLADRLGGGRGHGHRLVEQLQVLAPGDDLERGLDEREVRVVRDHGFREGREAHAVAGELVDRPDHLLDRSLAAVEHRAQLHRGRAHRRHRRSPWPGADESKGSPARQLNQGIGRGRPRSPPADLSEGIADTIV
jgi:hypothetical protein